MKFPLKDTSDMSKINHQQKLNFVFYPKTDTHTLMLK